MMFRLEVIFSLSTESRRETTAVVGISTGMGLLLTWLLLLLLLSGCSVIGPSLSFEGVVETFLLLLLLKPALLEG